jgi:hypothetical protein
MGGVRIASLEGGRLTHWQSPQCVGESVWTNSEGTDGKLDHIYRREGGIAQETGTVVLRLSPKSMVATKTRAVGCVVAGMCWCQRISEPEWLRMNSPRGVMSHLGKVRYRLWSSWKVPHRGQIIHHPGPKGCKLGVCFWKKKL